ncbi:MAG: hypothetical protein KUG71_10015 [Porticoccaceae bacterium]|nr:hypothetical protein [Porticoccaceae bacterium]
MVPQSDLNNFLLDYCSAFRPGNITKVAEFYHLPVTMIFANQVKVLNSIEEVVSTLQAIMDNLIQQSFHHSRVDKSYIHRLADKTALLSARFSRLNADDTVIETLGATYTVVDDGKGYRIAALIAHDTEAIISA